MRRLLVLFVCVAAAAAVTAPARAGAGRCIVVLDDDADPQRVAADHSRRFAAQVAHVYGHALRGYSAVIPDARVTDVRNDSRVAYVERGRVVHALAQTIPWGVDKVEADLSSTVAGDGTGAVSNVNAYVIDTGVADHPDIALVGHVNLAKGKNSDCNGHGTHVAGTIAARDNDVDVVGVAPGAPVTGVKVLGCSGSGSYSDVIARVDWVTANARRPAIANMSLGGPASQALDDAVRRSAAAGVFYSLAAGNESSDACTRSPARAGAGTSNGIMTVGATDTQDREASFSNHGACIDV